MTTGNQPIKPQSASNFQTYNNTTPLGNPYGGVPAFGAAAPAAGVTGAAGTTSSYFAPQDTYAKSTVKDADNALIDTVNRRLKEKGYMSGYGDLKTAIESAPAGTEFRKELEALKTNYDSASSVGDKFAVINSYNEAHPAAATNGTGFPMMPQMPGMGGMPQMPGMGGMPGANPYVEGAKTAADAIKGFDKKEKTGKPEDAKAEDREKQKIVGDNIENLEKIKDGAEKAYNNKLKEAGDSYEAGLTKNLKDGVQAAYKDKADVKTVSAWTAEPEGLIAKAQYGRRIELVDNVYGTAASADGDKTTVNNSSAHLIDSAKNLTAEKNATKPDDFTNNVTTLLDSNNEEKNINTVSAKSARIQDIINAVPSAKDGFDRDTILTKLNALKAKLDTKVKNLGDEKTGKLNSIANGTDSNLGGDTPTVASKLAEKEARLSQISEKVNTGKEKIKSGNYDQAGWFKIDANGNFAEDNSNQALTGIKATCEKYKETKGKIVADVNKKLDGDKGNEIGLRKIKENIDARIESDSVKQSEEEKKKEEKEIKSTVKSMDEIKQGLKAFENPIAA